MPDDSPDLAYTMSFVTSIGGLAAYWTRRSTLGMASGLGVGAAFALGGYWIQVCLLCQHCTCGLVRGVVRGAEGARQWWHPNCSCRRRAGAPPSFPSADQTSDPERHEMAHQMCLIASVLFGGE